MAAEHKWSQRYPTLSLQKIMALPVEKNCGRQHSSVFVGSECASCEGTSDNADLNLGEILFLHEKIIEMNGGSYGIRNTGRLESALANGRRWIHRQRLIIKKAEHRNHTFALRNIF